MQISERAKALQHEAFVFDALAAIGQSREIVSRLLEAGYDALNLTVSAHGETLEIALQKMAIFYWFRDAAADLVRVVTSAADLDDVHRGKLRIIVGFQGAEPIQQNFHHISIFHALGVRLVQLTYNEQNRLGYGCLEPDDRGLTHFGIQSVREFNRLGMVVDVSHAGYRTSLDAVNVSSDPVIASHSNPRSLRDNPRNITDEQMKAIAERGGVIGIASFADFVADTRQGQPTLAQYIDHIAYAVNMVGVEHVGIGTDAMDARGSAGIWWNANTKRKYPEQCGAMDDKMHGITGFESWYDFPSLTDGLLQRGFSDDDTRKIIGGNFLRVMRAVLR
ncbi:MAG TPA: membrane dipeptidase [Thermomicrobiales bacterium]|nr:membrane dipeptidase [Thermomicrobiales bacterium]